MDTPKELEIEFEKLVAETDLLLTQRQKMWVAFRAGAEWAMREIAKNASNPPSSHIPFYERTSR